MRTIQRDIVGVFIFSKDNKLLLGKTGVYKDLWVVPGGGIEEGETKLEAVKRETLEETGLDIPASDFQVIEGAFSGSSEKTLRDTGEHVLVEMKFYNYKVNLDKPVEEVAVKAADDFKDARWFTPEELKNLPLSPPTITTLQKLHINLHHTDHNQYVRNN